MQITEADREEFRYYTEDAIVGIKRIRMIPSSCLRRMLGGDKLDRYPENRDFQCLLVKMGPKTNPIWLVHRIADELYGRGELSEIEYDYITE